MFVTQIFTIFSKLGRNFYNVKDVAYKNIELGDEEKSISYLDTSFSGSMITDGLGDVFLLAGLDVSHVCHCFDLFELSIKLT